MGAGSTIAAAGAIGYQSIGIEIDPAYFEIAQRAIPKLAQIACERASFPGTGSREMHIAAAAEGLAADPR
jgi:hypothetical protein